MKVLSLCGSRKPAPNRSQEHSACRELLRISVAGIRRHGGVTSDLDLRTLNLPFFEGLRASEYPDSDLETLVNAVLDAQMMLIAAPAYWGGFGGALKNCLDLIGGPAYLNEEVRTPFANTTVGLMVVGAQKDDADQAERQLRLVLKRLGARCLQRSFIINNPQLANKEDLVRKAWDYGSYVALTMSRLGVDGG